MVHIHGPGSPLPFGKPRPADLLVLEAGDYEKDDGAKVVLSGGHLVFHGAFDGTHVTLGIEIVDLLDAIQRYTKENES